MDSKDYVFDLIDCVCSKSTQLTMADLEPLMKSGNLSAYQLCGFLCSYISTLLKLRENLNADAKLLLEAEQKVKTLEAEVKASDEKYFKLGKRILEHMSDMYETKADMARVLHTISDQQDTIMRLREEIDSFDTVRQLNEHYKRRIDELMSKKS